MKKIYTNHVSGIAFCAVFLFAAVLFPSAVFGAPAREGGVLFTDVESREWILEDVRGGGRVVTMDRQKLAADNLAGVYTITFEAGRVSGMGAPNRYSAPYTAGDNRQLSIGDIASTMMFSFIEPDGLRESEYFALLSNVNRWDLIQGKLELFCDDGTVLGFIRN